MRSDIIGSTARIWHVHEIDAGRCLEQFERQVADGARAERRDIDLARIGFRMRDELGEGLRGNPWVHHQHQRQLGQPGDRRDVALKIERQRFVERGIDRVGGDGEQQRVAVGRRIDHRLDADIGAAARLVLDHDRLAEPVRQPLRQEPRNQVGGAAGRIGHDPSHRPRRLGLREGKLRTCGEPCKLQELTARKSHGHHSAAACWRPCGRRSRKCGSISSAIAVMLARVMSSGSVPNWVFVSDVLKPARS